MIGLHFSLLLSIKLIVYCSDLLCSKEGASKEQLQTCSDSPCEDFQVRGAQPSPACTWRSVVSGWFDTSIEIALDLPPCQVCLLSPFRNQLKGLVKLFLDKSMYFSSPSVHFRDFKNEALLSIFGAGGNHVGCCFQRR